VPLSRRHGVTEIAMERNSLKHALVAGSIEHYELDMRHNRLSMLVHVVENGQLSVYALRFEKVSHFVFETDSKGDAGDRLEITEMWIDAAPEGSPTEEWELTVSVFDLTHLHIRCSSVFVGDEPIR
jgi:hypothetical protein